MKIILKITREKGIGYCNKPYDRYRVDYREIKEHSSFIGGGISRTQSFEYAYGEKQLKELLATFN